MSADDDRAVLHTIDPRTPKRIHLVGVAGTGMGSFAGMLKAAGYAVTGSDENVYPPMSDMLKAWGIAALTPYAAANLDAAKPDLVIIGNVIRRVNVEATAVRERGIPHMSFPAALGALFLAPRHSVVVAGTHGKTTTSSLMAHVLVEAGRDPSFLVGGVTQNYAGNYRLGKGPHVVLEGDEYDTAYFDKGPKFLHYQAKTLILTSVEFDHADIYRDLAHYESSFRALLEKLPKTGFVAVCSEYPNARALVEASGVPFKTYSGTEGAQADFTPHGLRFTTEGAHFAVRIDGATTPDVLLPMGGRHNVENALGVYAAAKSLGLSHEEISSGFASFRGVKRRQEVRGEPSGVMVVDDFAHHPTAVKETILAVKNRWPTRRVWAVFEPRSNTSRRNIHQDEYAHSFTGASRATIKVPEKHDKIPSGEELDVPRVAAELSKSGIPSTAPTTVQAALDEVAQGAQRGDVVLVMSNGSFGGFIDSLLKRLAERA
ncbi:MAG: UDP-N-acetylmuramate dehydrogenase [Archangium sp.]|nr:UDP-N-acetylmuramate dehydrogenase [Archangium sp.]